MIEGTNGPFVAMPSRKLTAHCPQCGTKNHLRAAHCNQCGGRLNDTRAPKDADGRAKLYADIAHPINSECREMIQDCVIREFYEEIERSKQPDYVSRYDDFDLDFEESRTRAARIDQPHSQPGSSHRQGAPKAPVAEGPGASKPHFRSGGNSESAGVPRSEPPQAGGFGAGIFPEK
jgi:stage V sporulation protein G